MTFFLRAFFSVFIFILPFGILYAEDSQISFDLCTDQKFNCISIGPEIYYMKRSREGGTKQHGILAGIYGNYDHIKPKSLYWGIEAYWATGRLNGKSGSGNKIVSNITDQEIEGRLGYTFKPKCVYDPSFTPFVGWGYFLETNKFKKPSPISLNFRDRFSYFVGGFLSEVDLNNFSVGANFKFKWMLDGKSQVSNDPDFSSATLGISSEMQYSLDLPISKSFFWCQNELNLSLVPYFEFRHYGGQEDYPFDFIDTKFRIFGLRFLANFWF